MRTTSRDPIRYAILLAAIAGCATGGEARSRQRADALSFEQFVADAYLEPWEGGVYIVDGDTPAATIDELRAIYDRLGMRERSFDGLGSHGTALSVHTVGGRDALWDATQRMDLSYCVSTGFGARHASVVAAMDEATAAWEAAADIRFRHVTAEDGACNASNPRVLFDVSAQDTGGEYLARAFFPGDPRSMRNVIIDPTAFAPSGAVTLVGILRHELGHVLGFRHEHTRAEAGTCFEDSSHRPLTPYDRASVMHYPHCNGVASTTLSITALDAQGAQSVYGAPGGTSTPGTEDPPPEPAPGPTEPPEDSPADDPAPVPGDGDPAATCVSAAASLGGGELHRYPPLAIPAGATIEITTHGAGDTDLYAYLLEDPYVGCASEGPTSDEHCMLSAPYGGSLLIELYGFTAASYGLEVCWR
ncbi:MAG: M57 family metalloprotease [Myxococcota bacterium]|nr:M57 family metalloprotease [Myxococcota bacterium]